MIVFVIKLMLEGRAKTIYVISGERTKAESVMTLPGGLPFGGESELLFPSKS